MNIPNLPQKFSGGETLTAAKLNALVDWMRDVAQLLPQLQVSAGPGLSYSRGAAGTTLSLARGFLQGGDGKNGESSDGGGVSLFERVLFNWTAAEVPGGSEGENPTGKITVSSGLVLVRPNSASGAAARSPSVIVSPAEGLGKASVKVPKYAAEFLPEFSSEFSVLTGAELNESSEPAVQTEISVDVSVPGYTLTKTGSASVLAGISTGSRSATVTIPAQTATSSSEYLTGAVLSLKGKTLTAEPGSAASWTESVVTTDSGSIVKTEGSRVSVTIPQATANATVSGVVTGTSSTSVPAGYKLEETGEASTKTAKVAVTLPDKILETTAEKFRPLGGGSVELVQSGEETLALDIEGAGEIGSAKLGGEEGLAGTDENGNPNLTAAAGDSGGKPQLCRVEGAEFSWGGGEKIVFLDVTGTEGGGVSFVWRMDDLSEAEGSTEYFSDSPQTLYLNVRAETVSVGKADTERQASGIEPQADTDGFAEGETAVNARSLEPDALSLNTLDADAELQASSLEPQADTEGFAEGETAVNARSLEPDALSLNTLDAGSSALGASSGSSASAQAFRVRAELDLVEGFSRWQVSVPMAYVCAGTGGVPHVEPLTWGCVEVTPPVRIVLNDGFQTETAAAAALAVSALAEAADYALATAEKDSYGLEDRDFF